MKVMQLKTKQFQKNKEDFVCDACGMMVCGDGYRNHCPRCLVSKHVDVHPGDRAATCGGLMKVVDIEMEHGQVVLTHHCETCGHKKRNRTHPEDHIDAIIAAMKQVNVKKPATRQSTKQKRTRRATRRKT